MAAGAVFEPPGSGPGCLDGDIGQCLTDVAALPGKAAGAVASGAESAVGDVASSAWDSICHSFADAFTSMLKWFGGVFASMPDPDLGSIHGVYAISLTLGMIVATCLVILQAGSVVWTRSGAPLAQALIGLPKAVLASLLTLAVSAQIMAASDDLAKWIVSATGTDMTGATQRLTSLLALTAPTGPAIPSVLLLLFGLIGIGVVLVLWLELVLRNAAFCVLVATAPIGAAGQIGSSTTEWWRKLVKAGTQLAMVKPVIALVFAIGLDTSGNATGITGVISGMAVLFMAVFAWPAIARLFTFTSVTMGGAMGAGAVVGAVANRTAGGGPGVDPAAFGQFSERQAMSANAARGAGAGAVGRAGIGAASGPAGVAVAAVQALHKTINAVASRMEQQAGYAGLEGANPSAYPAGYPMYGSVRMPRGAISSRSSGSTGEASDSATGAPTSKATNNGKA
ncbi:hypothetical protein [Catenulispora rubra]|uniref:hypothetical protein n=1 Tax=Catenulispora rubra TaxID=280293 RepID=UPI0018921FCB|nr:hypothetical protein [Catenulispora rubra]